MESMDTESTMSAKTSAVENNMVYAGFWARFFAMILDQLIWSLLIFTIILLAFGMVFFTNPEEQSEVVKFMINYVLPAIATIIFWKYKSATPGKMMMGMSVVDADTGGKPTTGRLVLRYFAYLISALPLFLGFFWVAFDARKQSFHDKIANTVVVMNFVDDDKIDTD